MQSLLTKGDSMLCFQKNKTFIILQFRFITMFFFGFTLETLGIQMKHQWLRFAHPRFLKHAQKSKLIILFVISELTQYYKKD